LEIQSSPVASSPQFFSNGTLGCEHGLQTRARYRGQLTRVSVFDDVACLNHEHTIERRALSDVVRYNQKGTVAPKPARPLEQDVTLVDVEAAKWLV
jgi:hypothetical protein